MSAFASSSGHTSARAFSSFVPQPELMHRSKQLYLFDYLVGAGEQGRRHGEAQCFCSLHIHHQLKLDWQLGRQIVGLGTFQYLNHIGCSAAKVVGFVDPVTDNTAILGKLASRPDGG